MSRPPRVAVCTVGSATPRNPNLGAAPRAVAIPSPILTEYMRGLVKNAGGDPSSVPDGPYKLMRPAAAAEIIGVSLATFYRMIDEGILPRPIPIDRASARAAAAG
jgi:predicted DNA-binding transcriptional regulator AlpA